MDRTEFFQATTLWFVAMVFLRTDSGSSGPLVTAIGLVAIGLVYLIPLYVLRELVLKLGER